MKNHSGRPCPNRSRLLPALLLSIALFLLVGETGCQKPALETGEQNDTLTQISLLNALLQGDYDGTVPLSELKQAGDTGLGTFDKLDGELIMLDGQVYKAKSDGTVELQPDSTTVPFAAVTGFDPELTGTLPALGSIADLKAALDGLIREGTGDFNSFYVARIDGTFDLIHVRSVPPQTKPYRPLAEITAQQVEFHYEKIQGTIVALRCPAYAEGTNLPGWHLHFLSADRTKGGHLLDARTSGANASLDRTLSYTLKLPGTGTFAKLNLGAAADAATTSVESKK